MPQASNGFGWTDQVVTRLRSLWAEGHSTAEIGRRLGVSKNAVVGKAHRLDLPARPSPIRRDGPGPSPPRRSVPRTIGPTLPPPYGRLVACCWPIGEPGTREFHFCDAESVPGKPYCADHAALAYVRVR